MNLEGRQMTALTKTALTKTARCLGAAFIGLAVLMGPSAAQDGPIDITAKGAGAKKTPAADVKSNAATDPDSTAALAPLTPQQIVQNANGYFNGMNSFVGDFVQINEDGRRYKGKLMVERPGKMRFDYAPPARVLIVSDGSTVAVIDERLKTKDRYPIGQTPLKFLLEDKINLSRDLRLIRAKADEQVASVTVEDKTTFGGTSRITMLFNRATFDLTGWRVTDGQGVTTTVQVSNIQKGKNVSEKNFVITDEDVFMRLQKGSSN
jgi:outer membrane lipoprotein-sorting protein